MKTDHKHRTQYVTEQFRHFANVTGYPVRLQWRESPADVHDDVFAQYDGVHVHNDVLQVYINGIDRWDHPTKRHSKRLDRLCDRLEERYPNFCIMVEDYGVVAPSHQPVQAKSPEEQAFHDATTHNRASIQQSTICGCYACERLFPASDVTPDCYCGDDTACCPHCGIDAVIGDASGFVLTPEYLHQLHVRWFE